MGRKTLALEYLAKIERGGETNELAEAHRQVNILTDEQQGRNGWHGYTESVDACLTLSLPGEHWWLMTSHTKASPVCSAAIVLERNREYAKTIPLAMLKAWWSLQTDD